MWKALGNDALALFYRFRYSIAINHFLKCCSDPTTFTDSQFQRIKMFGEEF
jgi:hypothetical protein